MKSRSTDVLIEYIEPETDTPYASKRTTASLDQSDAPLISPDIIGGHWRLIKIYRDAHFRLITTVRIFLKNKDLNAIKQQHNIVAHFGSEWTIGQTIASSITGDFIEIRTAISHDRMQQCAEWKTFGPASAGRLEDGSGKIHYEEAA